MTKLAVLRPEPDCHSDVELLTDIGIPSCALPCLEAKRLFFPEIDELNASDGIILTSKRILAMLDPDMVAHLTHLPVFCVGKATADAARQRGFIHIHFASGTAQSLLELLRVWCSSQELSHQKEARQSRKLSFSWLGGQDVQLDISAHSPGGCRIIRNICYEMIPRSSLPSAMIEELAAGKITAVMSLSARTLAAFVQLLNKHDIWHHHQNIIVLSISDTAGIVSHDICGDLQWRARLVAETPDKAGMIALVRHWCEISGVCVKT